MTTAVARSGAVLILAALLAAACGNGARDPEAPAQPYDFQLRVGITDPETLDPALADGRPAFLVLKQICDSLVAFDQATGELKPGLAESWTVSDDGKTIRFQLREGAKFSHGRDLTAEDLVYSLTRVADPKTESPHHYLLEKVSGYADLRSRASTSLRGLAAPEPRVFQVELAEPFAEFPALMAHPAAGSPVAKEAVESKPEHGKEPTCVGPYRVAANQSPQGTIELVRADGYHQANGAFSAGGRGYAQKIVFTIVANLDDAFELVEKDTVDLAPISAGDLRKARGNGSVESAESGHIAYIGFPVSKPPFDRVELRRSMAAAIDRRTIVRDLLGGSRAEAEGFLPLSSGPVAKLADCPAPEGSGEVKAPGELALYLNTGGGHEAWLQAVADDWEDGLESKTTLKTMDWAQYIDYLAGEGADGPFRLSWAVNFPSPEAVLNPLFATGSPNNFTRYSSSEFDGLLSKARATVDDGERAKLYADGAKVLCKDQPILPVWFGRNHVAFGPSVTSAADRRLDVFGDPILRELRLSG
jgi:oligopeptide transport system substrate-binding protein